MAARKKPRTPATLREYTRKRDFTRTAEPSGKARPRRARAAASDLHFVVQQHAARRMHYDFRLELDGVLKSWAIPKGPSLDPRVKRMAIQTEDHPLAYADFEGEIPAGEYGAGRVVTWDRGLWEPIGDPRAGLAKGHLGFRLRGEKLRGEFLLERMRPRPADRGKTAWLLIKRRDAAARSHAVAAAPREVGVQLATLVTKPPVGADWVHELKLDGYRILARVEAGKVALLTRNGVDRTRRMPALAAAFARLPVQSALVDGEVVALDAAGISRFARLQDALKAARADVHFYGFDLLFIDGEDLRGAALGERKKRLRKLLARARESSGLHYCEHTTGSGAEFLAEACRLGAEGIISKRLDAPYRAGRALSWLKSKCSTRQEFVVVGFTPGSGARVGLGALLLGVYDDDGALQYCGKVGTGFSDAALSKLRALLAKRQRAKPPVQDASSADRHARWVTPDLVAEVSFTEWTRDGKLRHPSFIALRTDKPASEIRIERARDPMPAKVAKSKTAAPSTVAGVALSSPDRVLFPDLGITKRELAAYCETMAERLLPGLVNRPLSLVRCPDGCSKPCFYQKHATESTPERVGRVQIEKGETPYAMVRNLGDVVALVQIATIELHVWGARADQIERPDLLVIDLDPDPAVTWPRVADTAQLLRAMLTELGLVPFLRTTGGKGLHVVAPLLRRTTWPELKAFAHAIALQLVKEAPDQYTAQISKARRRGKILIDYLRNQRDATAIASYSVRARPGAPVAMPIDWDELERKKGPPIWSLRDAPKRLREPDPWQEFERSRRALTAKARRSVGSA